MSSAPILDPVSALDREQPLAIKPFNLWSDDGDLPAWVQESAAHFDVDALLELVVPRCASIAFPSHTRDEAFLDRLRRSVRANAYALRSVIAGDLRLEDVYLTDVLELAAVQAQLRVPQKAIHRSYRISFFTMLEAWSEHVAAEAAKRDIEAEPSRRALKLLTQTVLSYQDFIASQVADTYTNDYELLSRSRAHMRRSLVGDLLRTGEAPTASDTGILGYHLSGTHLAVILSTCAEEAAAPLATRLRAVSQSQDVLTYPLSMTSAVVWLSRIADWSEEAIAGVRDVLTTAGLPASVGGPLPGIEGFAEALDQAKAVEQIRDAWPSAPTVVCFPDVSLEILLIQDTDMAAAFVQRELGALALNTPDAARLRETIEASCVHGSHVATATALQLHEHTVRNRLQKAESLLGHPISSRNTEIQVAVRLARLLTHLG